MYIIGQKMFLLQILICPGIKKLSQPPRRRPMWTSTENLTSPFCNNFSIIPSRLAWKMCSNYPVIQLT